MSAIGNMAINATIAYARFEIASLITNAILSPIMSAITSSVGSYDRVNLPRGNSYFSGLITTLAAMCAVTKGKRCYIKGLPLMSTGFENPFTSSHIFMATMGSGNTISGVGYAMPIVLLRKSPPYKNRSWLFKTSTCARATGSGLVCDEYPYASTWNGGEGNYLRDNVSLMLVPSREGSSQGGKLSKFYGKASVPPNAPFINIAIPALPSFYIDKKGKLHNL